MQRKTPRLRNRYGAPWVVLLGFFGDGAEGLGAVGFECLFGVAYRAITPFTVVYILFILTI